MDRLIVKNFGPLKDVDIELNKINLFIGENGSGKSILGKLITIISDFGDINSNIYDIEKQFTEYKKDFEEYNVNFLIKESIIKYYQDEECMFSLENEKFQVSLSNIDFIINEKEERVKKILSSVNNSMEVIESEKLMDDTYKLMDKITFLSSQYIPAERNLISLFNKSLTTLLVAEVPLPKFLLAFSSEFEKAGNDLKELEFLDVKYVNGDGLDRHKVYFNNANYLPLEQSSSGIQSALPLYLTVKYFSQKHRSIIIEEPEQNLFPKAQAETIKYIVEQVSDENSLFLMTHSPYVLSTLNILMMAYKAGNLNEVSKNKVTELYNEKEWINPDDFSAYYLEDGVARDIKGRTGLISDNEIDEISENIQGEFEELLSIYREHKNDK